MKRRHRLWDVRLRSELVASDPRLVYRYFGSHWLEAVLAAAGCPNTASPPLPSSTSSAETVNQTRALLDRMVRSNREQFLRLMLKRFRTGVAAAWAARPSALDTWIGGSG